jgi:hypothetical protein
MSLAWCASKEIQEKVFYQASGPALRVHWSTVSHQIFAIFFRSEKSLDLISYLWTSLKRDKHQPMGFGGNFAEFWGIHVDFAHWKIRSGGGRWWILEDYILPQETWENIWGSSDKDLIKYKWSLRVPNFPTPMAIAIGAVHSKKTGAVFVGTVPVGWWPCCGWNGTNESHSLGSPQFWEMPMCKTLSGALPITIDANRLAPTLALAVNWNANNTYPADW